MSRSRARLADYLTADALEGVPHAFSTREPLPPGAIAPGAPLILVKQVHGADVIHATRPFGGDLPEADALVTDEPGLFIGIVTADCAPVLFADREAGVVGAAHSGWRGAFAGVLENTVAAMVELGARSERMVAAIGPTIAAASYEVDEAFRERFLAADPANARWFEPGEPGHFQFDLPAYVAHRLASAGVGKVHDLTRDTYAESDLFHSYRRSTHRDQATGGRQTSVIGLP